MSKLTRWTRAQHEAYKALAGREPMSESTRQALVKQRAKPVQRERAEQVRLTIMAQRAWWWPGYRHHMQERRDRSEAWRGRREGVKPGWPDVTLHIPSREWPTEGRQELTDFAKVINWTVEPVLAALELKVGSTAPTQSQLDCLALLESCGYRTSVQWGADAAFAWLDKVAGPKPDEMPERWG